MKIVGPQLRSTVCPLVGLVVFFLVWRPSLAAQSPSSSVGQPELNDAHFHLTNSIQKGGEFTIHKEFVSAKVAGETASLRNPALDRILGFAADVLIHNDMDAPFAKTGTEPAYLSQMESLLKRHPAATIIWAHTGMGRVVRPVAHHAATIEAILRGPQFGHVYFDISWNEVAKHLVATPESTKISADLLNRYPDRFLFGTDEVAPTSQEQYLKIYDQYRPLWALLTPEASEGNYERIFDTARHNVRAWEAAHQNDPH